MDIVSREASIIFRTRKGEYLKGRIKELEANRRKTFEAYTEAYMNLRRVTKPGLTWLKVRMVVVLQTPTIF
jgi:hypothetical protein